MFSWNDFLGKLTNNLLGIVNITNDSFSDDGLLNKQEKIPEVYETASKKGINFVDLKDAGDPVEQAKIYSDGGADEICFLDITASNENRDIIYDVVKKTSKKCFVPLTVGGGIKNIEDINKLLNCGADKVSINTAAVENSKVILDSSKKFGSQCIVVAIDAKKNGDKWEVFTHGGRNNSGIDALEYAKQMEENGAGELLVTSMDRDGTQVGYDIDLMSKISSKINIPLPKEPATKSFSLLWILMSLIGIVGIPPFNFIQFFPPLVVK